MLAVTLALIAAVGYAVASVLQQRAAAAVPSELSMRIGLLTRLLGRPLWLVGVAADITAFAFEAMALAFGSLVVVQPVLVLGLPIALVLGAALTGQHFGRQEAGATAAVCGALVLFLGLNTPGRGHELAGAGRCAVVAVVVAIGVAAALVAAGRQPHRRATWLAAATGLVFALSAALTKSVASLVRRVGFGTAGHWELYALIVVGGASMLLAQSAFQAGPLRQSLPVISLVPPFASAAIGAYLFRERLHRGGFSPVVVAADVLSGVLAIAGVVALARSPLAESAYSASAASGSVPGVDSG